MTAPVVIPTTSAPAQSISVNLGGQNCRIELYTKSINVPAQSGPAFSASDLIGIGYGVALDGTSMVVSGSVVGDIPIGATVTGNGLQNGTTILAVPVGTLSRLGTYTLSATSAGTPQTRVTAYVSAAHPGNEISTDPPRYENRNPVFVDLYLNDALVIGGVLLQNRNAIVRNSYFGFAGDIAVIDAEGNSDPYGVPLRLPPADLMNSWQRDVPLALGGNAPPALAMTLPGMGTRFLLTYWPDLE